MRNIPCSSVFPDNDSFEKNMHVILELKKKTAPERVLKFYRRHIDLVSKFNIGFKTLLYQGLSEREFYGDLVYKFKKNVEGLIFLISSEKLSYVTNVLEIIKSL